MSFISVHFLLFLIVVIVLYFVVPQKYQWCMVAAANLWFYVAAGWKAVPFLLITTVSTYLCGRLLGKIQKKYKEEKKLLSADDADIKNKRKKIKILFELQKKKIMWGVLLLNFSIWFLCKQSFHTGSLFIPFAISYYTFIAVGYCIDVYSGKYDCEKNLIRYFAFLSFFPQMIEGPFSRYDSLTKTLFAGHSFSFERFEKGMLRVIWGYCKKMVLSNIMWEMISIIYAQNGSFSAPQMIMLIIMLPLQQYADFSGCMDIAIGISQIMGIELQENFHQPIFAKSVEEIWRRWHLTLCAWFRDYLFYPVALNKSVNQVAGFLGKKNKRIAQIFPSTVALFVVWTTTGLWHGTAWKYILWGWMNFFFLEANMLFKNQYGLIRAKFHINTQGSIWKLFCIIRTYFIFGIMELIADGPSAGQDIRMLLTIFDPTAWLKGNMIMSFVTVKSLIIILVGACILCVIDIMKEQNKNIANKIITLPIIPKCLVYVSIIYMIVLLTPVGINVSEGFAYAQF